MGTVRSVTDDSFEAEVLAQPAKPVIVECVGPVVRPVPPARAGARGHRRRARGGRSTWSKMNADENPRDHASGTAMMLVPTINVFAGGEVVKQLVGARSKSAMLREVADFL